MCKELLHLKNQAEQVKNKMVEVPFYTTPPGLMHLNKNIGQVKSEKSFLKLRYQLRHPYNTAVAGVGFEPTTHFPKYLFSTTLPDNYKN